LDLGLSQTILVHVGTWLITTVVNEYNFRDGKNGIQAGEPGDQGLHTQVCWVGKFVSIRQMHFVVNADYVSS
jgi:hypothetical protein